jgi:cell division protein FtsL
MKKLKTYFVWLLLVIFVIANVYFTVEFATSGAEIAGLEKKEAELTEESNSLSEELLKTTSLNDIAQKAGEMGFAKPTRIVYLNGEEPVAKLPFQGKP